MPPANCKATQDILLTHTTNTINNNYFYYVIIILLLICTINNYNMYLSALFQHYATGYQFSLGTPIEDKPG